MDSIIKKKEKLEMEYVKALCTAFDDERKRDKIEARAIGSALQPPADPYMEALF